MGLFGRRRRRPHEEAHSKTSTRNTPARSQIQATTLDWGTPFYSKVQTSTAIGQGPDIMTYHASRIPLGVSQNVLTEITDADMKTIGMSANSFAKSTWDAVHVDGKQYAVPFDTHPIVLYYNKDKLADAGLIGADGLPTGLNGVDNFMAALKKLKAGGSKWGIASVTADGSFAYRTIYSLLCQQDGQTGRDGDWFPGRQSGQVGQGGRDDADWVKAGVNPPNTDYPDHGRPVHVRRRPVDDQRRLGSADHGRSRRSISSSTGARSSCRYFSITPAPTRIRTPSPSPTTRASHSRPEKHAAVLETIKWLEAHALFWATAGHIPANKAVTDSAEYKAMQPQATYAKLTANGIFDPRSKFAGVASPLFEAAGNAFTPALNGEKSAKDAAAEMVSTMNALK